MIPVMWHYGGRGSWCHEICEFLTRGCEHSMGLYPAKRAIVVVKADSIPSVHQLDSDLGQFERGVLIVFQNLVADASAESGCVTLFALGLDSARDCRS